MSALKPDPGTGDRGHLDCSRMKDWEIAVAPDAIPAEHYAAEEFQHFFCQATGLDLPLYPGATPAPRQVRLGTSSSHTTELGEEDFCIAIEKDGLHITGGRPRGTLYGVYQVLEDFLGLRFLTQDHTHVPDSSKARIPCGTYTCVPPLSFRWSAYGENSKYPEGAARLRVNTVTDEERLGGRTGQELINHSVHILVPYDRHGQDHPEYYALVDGERDSDTHGGGPQLCVTNPEVVEIAAETAIRILDENPHRQNISVSQADTERYCHCDACEAINQQEGTPMGAQLAFVNAVAERIEKVHPQVKVGTLAYWYTRQLPRTIRPRPNVQIQLCSIECCTLHAIDDPNCEKNRAFCNDMDAWGQACDDIWIWNYNTNFRAYDLPFPNLRSIGPNLRYFHRNHAKGAFMQAAHNGLTGELCDLRNYIISRMLWDPDQEGDQLCEEFVRLHYQEAAPPILDYLGMLHDNAEARGLHPTCFPTPEEIGLDPEISRKALDYFAQALDLAPDDAIRARVEKVSICAHRAMIEAGGLEGAERAALIDQYIALGRRYGMTQVSERQPAEEYYAELK